MNSLWWRMPGKAKRLTWPHSHRLAELPQRHLMIAVEPPDQFRSGGEAVTHDLDDVEVAVAMTPLREFLALSSNL